MTAAVIDIGSNSVRLMLWADGKSIYKKIFTTRLGEGLAVSGRISIAAMLRTAEAVAQYRAEAEQHGAKVYAFATAAVRRSENGGEFCSLVREMCGVSVDVVSGEEEARLALCGALGEEDGAVFDIGGASSEVCVRQNGSLLSSVSLDVGAVRLFDLCGQDKDKLEEEIDRALSPLSSPISGNVYAVGGTASTLASLLLELPAYDAARIQDFPMRREVVFSLADRLLSLSVEEKKHMKGMDAARADIIAGGALLLGKLMEKTSVGEVLASDRDNLEGYLFLRGLQ